METNTSRHGGQNGDSGATDDGAQDYNTIDRIAELTEQLGAATRKLDRNDSLIRDMRQSLTEAQSVAEERKGRAQVNFALAATLGTLNSALAGWAKAESEARLMRAKAESECQTLLVKALAEKAEPSVLVDALSRVSATEHHTHITDARHFSGVFAEK